MTRRSADSAAAKAVRNRGGRPKNLRSDPGLAAVIQAAGSLSALASGLGVSVGAVSQWTYVPAKDVDRIATKYGLTRHALRPDLFAADDSPIPS